MHIYSARRDRVERSDDVLVDLGHVIAVKDADTAGHLRRTACYTNVISALLDMPSDQRRALHAGALLHDIGKLGIDAAIIHKPGPLTPNEYRAMQQHPIIGERIVEPLHLARSVALIVRHHQERWDGRGYPDHLAQEDIPLGARIVAVADAFDAMTSQRVYRPALTTAEAGARLVAGAGSCWEPQLVRVFARWLQRAGARRVYACAASAALS